MTTRLLEGDCRVTLPTLAERSAQACVTSPPYYGLRDYGLPPLVWGGEPSEWGAGGIHLHEFGTAVRAPWANELPSAKSETRRNNAFHESMGKTAGSFCECGAWLGSLGLEPSPDLYIEHLVECFRGVRRVLRDDGVLWLNLGDSYAGSGNGAHDYRERNKHRSLSLHPDKYKGQSTRALQRVGPQEHSEGAGRIPGYKPKDLMLMPFRVAMALQADGWTLRAHLPWLKRNCMPGSEKDRPTVSVESVFLFSKKRRYFWDHNAVHRTDKGLDHRRTTLVPPEPSGGVLPPHKGIRVPDGRNGSGRNWRTGDMFFDSWQGMLVDDDGDPLALVVNPRGYSEAHFATFPPKLVEPMVVASTRPGDTILDPFGGAGTVGLVADRLQRNAVLCELKPDYVEMGTKRIVDDAPMFTEVAAG